MVLYIGGGGFVSYYDGYIQKKRVDLILELLHDIFIVKWKNGN